MGEELRVKGLIDERREVAPRFHIDLARREVGDAVAEIRVRATDVGNPTDGDGTAAADETVPVIEDDVVFPVRSVVHQSARNLVLIRLGSGQRVVDPRSRDAVPCGHRG